jgi:hypothetical protein
MSLNRIRSIRWSCVFTLFVLLFSVGARTSPAQMGSQGTVNVDVLDPSGSVVQGAKLVLQDLATNNIRNGETQQTGGYSFAVLPIGTYRLTVTKDGFQTQVLNAVEIQGGRVTDVKVTLKVGVAVEKVVVSETNTPLIETSSSAIATTIDIKQIEDLPLQGRDISALAFLTPGFSGTPGSGTWNGLPLIAQGNTIDGVLSSTSRMKFGGNVQPGLEARLEDLQEMTVQTGQTDLNQSTGTASMQVNFVTRRGSNNFHGRVFDDFRNTALNANSWFNNAQTPTTPRNPIILNDFGGSVGGRIIKDKLFFFASFAMAKQPGGFFASNTILSAAAQQGIFTYTQGPLKGQTVNLFSQIAQPNGLPATANQASVAPELALINKAISLGTVGPGLNGADDPNIQTLSWQVSSPTTRYYPAMRVDYDISQKLRLDFSLEESKVSQPNGTAPPFPGSDFANQAASFKSNNYITSLGLNWTVTPNLINQFRAGYYYNAFWYAYGAKPTWDTLPQIGWPVCPGGPPLNCSGNVFNLPVTTYYPIVNAVDNATWVRGVHSITFGFDFYREQDHYWNPPDGIPNIGLGLVNGDPAFNAFESYFASADAFDRGEAENLYATLVGRVSSVGPVGSGFPYNTKTHQYATTPGTAYNLDELQKGWGLYAQDSFRITPHLTFNYGLRWDFVGDDHDLTAAYHGSTPAAIYGPSGIGNVFKPGTLTGDMNPAYVASSHQYNPWNVTPQPTIGLAWNPTYSEGILAKLFGAGNTVIRAGFDIKRFTEPYQYFWNSATNHGLAYFQGFSLQPGAGTGAGTFAPGSLSLGDTLPPYIKFPPAYATSLPESLFTWNTFFSGAGFDSHIQQPYVQEWNLGIQRQLNHSNVLEVRYLGHRSVHQWIVTNPNEVNIFENGFLKQFQSAQSNLKICMANPSCASKPSFGDQGLPGQVPLPIFDAAFFNASNPGVGESGGPGTYTDYSNSSFITDLNNGAAGTLATTLAYPFGPTPYICNMVGSALSPCATAQFGGFTSAGPYPLNFFQANPYADGNAPGSALANTGAMSAQGFGNYHALQVDFRQKPWHGMQFDANYTWSHTLGLQPDNQWTGSVNIFSIRDLRQSYGPTSFDLRHVVHASGTFDLPLGYGKALLSRQGPVDKIVGGWTLGTIFTYQTGLPFQLLGGFNTFNDYGDGGLVLNGITKSQLQNAVGIYHVAGPYIDVINPKLLTGSTCGNSVLVGVCQNTTPGTFGINPWLYGVHVWNDDLSLSKSIPIRENIHFTFQAEFLNVFNHPNFTTPGQGPFFIGSTNVQNGGFGRAGLLNFTNVATNNNNSARVVELRANISF